MGEYDETPDETGHMLHDWAEQGIVNILGGCCGTTPDHIRHVADAVRGLEPGRSRSGRRPCGWPGWSRSSWCNAASSRMA